MFGRKTVYYKNGKYVGELSGSDKRHGYGVFINSNSVSLLGRWMNDNLIKAIINYEDGSKYIGSLLNGDYHGKCYTFNLNTGYLASATYEHEVQKPIIF